MKKLTALLIAIMILLTFKLSVSASDITVSINGSNIDFDVSPCIIDDYTFVPIRGVFDSLGVSVAWDDDTKTVYAVKDGISVWLQADNPVITYQKDGVISSTRQNANPRIVNDRILVPVRLCSELFGASVSWDAPTRRVSIVTYDYINQSLEEPTLSLSGFVSPDSINCGNSFSLYGIVSTNTLIDRLNIKIIDKASGKVEINETKFDILSCDYSLSDIDSRIKFGTLSVGDKLLQITAVTAEEYREVFSYDFTVTRPEGAKLDGDTHMLWPVPSSGLITTIFWCDNVFCHSNAGRVNGHAAIDIAGNEDDDVVAVMDGVVISCGFGDYLNAHSGYGNYIEVDHGNGLITQYAHLNSIYVSEGDVVSMGQVIGGVGNTGNSTGNHLDFSIEKDGERCDPLYYLDMHEDVRCHEECDKVYFEEALQIRGITLN